MASSSQVENGGAKVQCLIWKSEEMDKAIEVDNNKKIPISAVTKVFVQRRTLND